MPRWPGMSWHWQTARKAYKCDWCDQEIPKGTRYGKYTPMTSWGGYEADRTYYLCETCEKKPREG